MVDHPKLTDFLQSERTEMIYDLPSVERNAMSRLLDDNSNGRYYSVKFVHKSSCSVLVQKTCDYYDKSLQDFEFELKTLRNFLKSL